MSLYTKYGDKGHTYALGLKEVGKHHCIIEACGVLDEVSALIGVYLHYWQEIHIEEDAYFEPWLKFYNKVYNKSSDSKVQNPYLFSQFWFIVQTLFLDLGSIITWLPKKPNLPHEFLGGVWVDIMEQMIDILTQEVEPLTEFILPSGSPEAARLHHLRTVVRRAERAMSGVIAELAGTYYTESVFQFREVKDGMQFLNRLSDLLFMMARYYNRDKSNYPYCEQFQVRR